MLCCVVLCYVVVVVVVIVVVVIGVVLLLCCCRVAILVIVVIVIIVATLAVNATVAEEAVEAAHDRNAATAAVSLDNAQLHASVHEHGMQFAPVCDGEAAFAVLLCDLFFFFSLLVWSCGQFG